MTTTAHTSTPATPTPNACENAGSRPMTPRRGSGVRRLLAALTVLLAVGCAEDSPVEPRAELDFLVGDWAATSLVVQSVENPSQEDELLDAEGSYFRINVQPSGQYTAILNVTGFPATEIGRLDVDGEELVFRREYPSEDVSQAEFVRVGEDRVRLIGDTEFDFSGDLLPESARLITLLERR